MKHYLFVSIDTEEDLWGGYTVKNPPLENIKNIPVLQEIFEKYHIIPTYLINYPVANDNYSIELFNTLLTQDKIDLGTHCHPWNNPPFVDDGHLERNSFMCNLSEELVSKKMMKLHDAIKNNFRYTPIVFRAGRWGVGENVMNVIQKLGYKIDTSITPFRSWEEDHGPRLYSKSNVATGMIGMEILCSKAEDCKDCGKNDRCIVEIPPTTGFCQNNFILCHNVRTILMRKSFNKLHILGILDRMGLLNFRALSPETSTLEDMVKLSKVIMKKGHRFLNMSFHSTSLLPGKSPFVKNDRELGFFLAKIDRYLDFMTREGVAGIGMSEAMEVLS